ncbi:MAG: response regulator [Anaerolineae bacterium]|nr:response regulator [Anaerolineae bacterium]
MDKILIVDDDQVFCGLLKTVLEFEGYEAIIEPDPEAVVPKAREIQPMLILMDVHSEKRDTLDIVRKLKADENLGSIPVVMTSGMDRSPECEKAGADAFILKPFRPDELVALVAEVAKKPAAKPQQGVR